MHCPRCGQQQVSDEIKFCSRCGLPLGLVAEVVAQGGFLPQLANLQNNKKWLTRKNALKISLAWFLLATFILLPLSGVAGADELAGFFAIAGFLGGILMMIFSLMFLPKEEKGVSYEAGFNNPHQTAQFTGMNTQQTALPPPTSQPVDSYMPPVAGSWKAPDTGELARPGSVTENTTKLLNKEE